MVLQRRRARAARATNGDEMIAAIRERDRVVDRGDVRELVDRLLGDAVNLGASDIHVEPMSGGYEVRYRVDGLLEVAQKLDVATVRSVVGRLMVMGHLLKYRIDVPQEGRIETLI